MGLVLNIAKRVFRQAQLSHIGKVITIDGVKPDPEKVQAISATPTPTNVTELQCVLGLVMFLGHYIPNMSARTAPLRQLLEKDIDCSDKVDRRLRGTG